MTPDQPEAPAARQRVSDAELIETKQLLALDLRDARARIARARIAELEFALANRNAEEETKLAEAKAAGREDLAFLLRIADEYDVSPGHWIYARIEAIRARLSAADCLAAEIAKPKEGTR